MKYLLASFAGHFIWGGVFFVLAVFLGIQIMQLKPLVGAIPFTLILGCLSVCFFTLLAVSHRPRWMLPKTLSSYFFLFIPGLAFVLGLGLTISGLFVVALMAAMGLHR